MSKHILLVEDDEAKRTRLKFFLEGKFGTARIELARSLQAGLRCLRNDKFDLIILDMTLPNYDPGPHEPGGKPQIFGGREFLRQMDRFDINIPVIVVTQFASFGRGSGLVNLKDLDEEMKKEYGTKYRGAVYYNAAIRGWAEQLIGLLDVAFADEGGERA
ncbi:MAG TPA: response regulator [Acidobacteriaceae bacterium]|jgi:CheY-like chemotaxis protein|nr:response regulator [Acidobacteriaceae bacterium]